MNNRLRSDIEHFLHSYPIFKVTRESNENVELKGLIDIIDVEGNYWDSYDVTIVVSSHNYPNTIPLVYELSNKIVREDDWHISKVGECCLDITHNLILLQNRGINLISFYQNKIYPFFTNHQYKLRTGEYANGDYPHQLEGIKYFYEKEIGLSCNELIVTILAAILKNKLPEKLAICVCGHNKYKHCHLPVVTKLIRYGKQRLSEDLLLFRSYEIAKN